MRVSTSEFWPPNRESGSDQARLSWALRSSLQGGDAKPSASPLGGDTKLCRRGTSEDVLRGLEGGSRCCSVLKDTARGGSAAAAEGGLAPFSADKPEDDGGEDDASLEEILTGFFPACIRRAVTGGRDFKSVKSRPPR